MKKLRPVHRLRTLLIIHLARNAVFALLAIIIGLYIGMLGYHYFEKMTWIDAFANASMILSGMGPLTPLNTYAGKLFAGLYALFSGLTFIVLIALIISPIIHHVFRKMDFD